MVNLSDWINMSHGLALNKGELQARDNENGILFLVEAFFIKDILKQLKGSDINTFIKITDALQSYDKKLNQISGLYDRGAAESLLARGNNSQNFLRTISHDNLTAISAFSSKYKLPYAKDIAKYGIKHAMCYDNRYNLLGNPQWHPRDWFFWFWNAGGFFKFLALPWLPIFVLANIVTCFSKKQETSGKLLMFVRLMSNESFLFKLLRNLCFSILRFRYGKKWLFEISKIYFYQNEHPIPILASQVEL